MTDDCIRFRNRQLTAAQLLWAQQMNQHPMNQLSQANQIYNQNYNNQSGMSMRLEQAEKEVKRFVKLLDEERRANTDLKAELKEFHAKRNKADRRAVRMVESTVSVALSLPMVALALLWWL